MIWKVIQNINAAGGKGFIPPLFSPHRRRIKRFSIAAVITIYKFGFYPVKLNYYNLYRSLASKTGILNKGVGSIQFYYRLAPPKKKGGFYTSLVRAPYGKQ